MAGECGGGNVGTGYDSGASSPKNKVKFLCSHGGKILPRPVDGQLKYVGGETRVIAVPRDITFSGKKLLMYLVVHISELMQKVTALIDCDMVLKYQPFLEDLDTLVSVRSDEDLKHMFKECDRYESRGALMLRAFLFPSKPIVLENQTAIFEPHLLEQRYIDAINGIIQTSSMSRLSPIRVLSTPSACSSPKSNSPEGHTVETVGHESYSFGSSCSRSMPVMNRVRSNSSINSLSSQHSHCSSGFGSPKSQQYEYGYHHNHNYHQHCPPHGGYLSARPSPPDPQVGVGMGRAPSPYSVGKCSPYHPTIRHSRGNGGCSKDGYHDEYAQYRFGRAHSLPRSPRYLMYEQ